MFGWLKAIDDNIKRSAKEIEARDYNYQSWHPHQIENWIDFTNRMVKEGRMTKREAKKSQKHFRQTGNTEKKTVDGCGYYEGE